MTWRIDSSSDTPPSKQLVEAVLDAISCGELAPGDKLPSVRRLATEALVNPNTVAKAYRDLEQMGAAEGQNGRGVFVTPRGESVARKARQKATLEGFRRTVKEALRAGHDLSTLEQLLIDEATRKSA